MSKIIGVIGAGVMGTGVAQSFAQSGYSTVLIDISEKKLSEAKDKIKKNLRFQRLFSQENAEYYDIDSTIDRIIFEKGYGSLVKVDALVENVTENWDIKKDVYQEIDKICSADCFFGVNTSAIPITRIASLTNRPHKVVGIHFMNPVPLIPMVEVIKGYHTDEVTMKQTQDLIQSLKKQCIVVNDSPGFVTNRAMMIFVNEAIFMLQEQVATSEEIDTLFKQCFGHKMGPLQTADLIGLDTILNSLTVLYDGFNDNKYRPCTLLKKMVDAGLHGVKSGRGFYDYSY